MFKNGHETLNEWVNLADFLHANAYSGKLKDNLVVIGGYVQI